MDGGREERLTNLRFADDLLIIAETEKQLATMVGELAEETERIGLEMHMGKTKVLTTEQAGDRAKKRTMRIKESKIEINLVYSRSRL